jgi:hypothetical protein
MNLLNLLFFISTISCRSGNGFTSLLGVPVLPQNTQQAMDIVSSVESRTDFMAILSIWTSEIQRFVFVENLKWNEIQFKMFQERFYEQVGTPLCTLHRQISGFEGVMYCFQGNQQQRLVLESHISIKFLNWDVLVCHLWRELKERNLDFVQLECECKWHKGSREAGVCCTLTVTVCSKNLSLIIRSGRPKV